MDESIRVAARAWVRHRAGACRAAPRTLRLSLAKESGSTVRVGSLGSGPRSGKLGTILRKPAATVGDQILMPGGSANGPRDQREVELRDDVLVYSSPMLERPVEVTGPVELRPFVASSARDMDFTGKLVDVFPDGRRDDSDRGHPARALSNSFRTPELLEPDAVYELRIDLWATANVFLPGHRIRLEVSSSNFPRFDRTAIRARRSRANLPFNTDRRSIASSITRRIRLV